MLHKGYFGKALQMLRTRKPLTTPPPAKRANWDVVTDLERAEDLFCNGDWDGRLGALKDVLESCWSFDLGTLRDRFNPDGEDVAYNFLFDDLYVFLDLYIQEAPYIWELPGVSSEFNVENPAHTLFYLAGYRTFRQLLPEPSPWLDLAWDAIAAGGWPVALPIDPDTSEPRPHPTDEDGLVVYFRGA